MSPILLVLWCCCWLELFRLGRTAVVGELSERWLGLVVVIVWAVLSGRL